MKRNNKKGFTIVELVIVIAVIAILSAVLIPTFGGIVEKANASAAQQEAKNAHTMYIADIDYVHGETATTIYVVTDDGVYSVTAAGVISKTEMASIPTTGYYDAQVEDVAAGTIYLQCTNHVDTNAHDLTCDRCNTAVECNDNTCNIHSTPAAGDDTPAVDEGTGEDNQG